MAINSRLKGIGLLDNPQALKVLVAVVAVLAVVWIWLKISAARRKPKIHPRLQKYAGPDAEFARKRREEAARIVVTSSTQNIAGYEIVEQFETVFVDDFRRPEEAIEGVKAVAAMKGANAVVNLKHDRTSGGRCSASGDAVVVRKKTQ